MDGALVGILLGVTLATAFVWGQIATVIKRKKRIKECSAAYQAALQGTDKQVALAAGRAYYSSLRFRDTNYLHASDELVIANDIAAMKG